MTRKIGPTGLLLLVAGCSDTGVDGQSGGEGTTAGSAASADPEPTGTTVEPATGGADSATGGADSATGGADSATGLDPSTSTTDPFAPPVLDECIDDGSAGAHVYTCGDLSYDVMIPEACLESPCGLIVDVHGFTMSGRMQDANTSLKALGAERGYIVIQPNANPAPPSSSWVPGVDDEQVVAFMERVAHNFHVDPDRLHFTGFSQGGFMTWRVVCAHADLLASVAPAAACGDRMIGDCLFGPSEQPRVPVDILYLHGTDDVLVPYECAQPRRDAVVAAYDLGPEEIVLDGEGYRWTRHTAADGAVLEFITHQYNAENTAVLGGHCYPGSEDPGDAPGQLFSYACIDRTDLRWGEAVIDFFDEHPRD